MKKKFLRSLGNLSFFELWSVLAKPSMISVLLAAPRSSTIYETVSFFLQDKKNEEVENLRVQFLRHHRFFQELNEKLILFRHRRTNCEGWPEFLYVLLRLVKPEVVIETGVFDGISSAVILQALEDNGTGKLISIDLPATSAIKESTHRMKETTLPNGLGSGWVIPDYLRGRHELILGDSKTLLPEILKKHPTIDIFIHDSLHTYECQKFEYENAWPKLKMGGWLLSDDVLWTAAFDKFSKQVKRPYKIYYGLGALRK